MHTPPHNVLFYYISNNIKKNRNNLSRFIKFMKKQFLKYAYLLITFLNKREQKITGHSLLFFILDSSYFNLKKNYFSQARKIAKKF